MTFEFVDPKIYEQYKEQVVELSQSIQVNYVESLPLERRQPGLSDEQIADKLGLDVATVREIRCVAEREYYDIDEWHRAIEFKDRTCRNYRRQGMSSVTKKYFEEKKKQQPDQ